MYLVVEPVFRVFGFPITDIDAAEIFQSAVGNHSFARASRNVFLFDQQRAFLFGVSAQQIGKSKRDRSFVARSPRVQNFVKLIVVFGDLQFRPKFESEFL